MENRRAIIIGVIVIVLIVIFGLNSGPSSNKCGWCNGSGWVTNGAKNATEFALKKSTCPYCHGTGRIK